MAPKPPSTPSKPLCQICGKAPAIKSHIIPQCFNFGDTTLKLIPVNPGSFPKRASTGIYDRLLCQICDGRWGAYDDYAAKVLLRGEPQHLRRTDVFGNSLPFVAYEYHKLHTFFITLLWRALHSDHVYFSMIRDPLLREQIDRAVYMGDQDLADWHLVMFGYFSDFSLRGSLQPILRKCEIGNTEHDCVLLIINNLHVTITYGDRPVKNVPQSLVVSTSGRTLITPLSFTNSYAGEAAEGMVKNYPNAFKGRRAKSKSVSK